MMTSNEIRVRELDFLKRTYEDGYLNYEAYDLKQQGVAEIINLDAENRFNRQMNRAESYERRLVGDIPPTEPTSKSQQENEVDEFTAGLAF
jgi:hypothetical protein